LQAPAVAVLYWVDVSIRLGDSPGLDVAPM